MKPARRFGRVACAFGAGLAVCVGAAGVACAQAVAPSEGAGANPERGPARPTGSTIADSPPGSTPTPTTPGEPSEPREPGPPPAPESTAPAEPEMATLRVEALAPGQRFDVQVVSSNGSTQAVTGVEAGHPGTVRNVLPGTALVRVTGAATFERRVSLDSGRSILRLSHAPARNGVLWGTVSLLAGLALGGGAFAIAAPCINGPCDVESQTAFTVPMALLGAAGVGLGIGMLAWHVPEQNQASVELDFSDDSARREHAPRVFASVAPAPGGGALATLAARF